MTDPRIYTLQWGAYDIDVHVAGENPGDVAVSVTEVRLRYPREERPDERDKRAMMLAHALVMEENERCAKACESEYPDVLGAAVEVHVASHLATVIRRRRPHAL
jgi:hypothetical protein